MRGDRPLSVYVHLPFCIRKCHYCDFNSRPAGAADRARYLDALHREIGRRVETFGAWRVCTIYFGGGTPTLYEAEELGELLRVLRERTGASGPAPDCDDRPSEIEISIEANPETVNECKLTALREAGFNRISLGAQSFDDDELALLGRGHCAEQTEAAAAAARAAGFGNLSLDLIYALPGQTVESWRHTLTRALELAPDHLSAYGLELAEGTPLAARVEAGEIPRTAEGEHLTMRGLTRELCAQAGLQRYEISNYARPGFECRHNVTYWRNEPYLGLGAGAWSYLDGERSMNLREPDEYCAALERGHETRGYSERLRADEALFETVMMGLRMAEGVSLARLRADHGDRRVDALLARAEPLVAMGLVEVGDDHLRLTEHGEPLHSEIVVRLV